MKRYISISITIFLFSAVNVLTYILLGVVYGNNKLSELFTLTYPLQFISLIILSFFCVASNIRANKEDNKNCAQTGIILGIIAAAILFSILAVFVDEFITFMNFDPAVFHTFTLMIFGQLLFSFVITAIAEKYYLKNKDKQANLVKIGFIILKS